MTDLFTVTFAWKPSPASIVALKHAAGMLVGDLGNPWKDAPGSGTFGRDKRLHIVLSKHNAPQRWTIGAFTHQTTGIDIPAVESMRRSVLDWARIHTTDVASWLPSLDHERHSPLDRSAHSRYNHQ